MDITARPTRKDRSRRRDVTCRRAGMNCGKPPVFMPMRSIELRPHPPATCARAATNGG